MSLRERRRIAGTWTVAIITVIALAWLGLTISRLGSFGSPTPSATPSATDLSNSSITPPY